MEIPEGTFWELVPFDAHGPVHEFKPSPFITYALGPLQLRAVAQNTDHMFRGEPPYRARSALGCPAAGRCTRLCFFAFQSPVAMCAAYMES